MNEIFKKYLRKFVLVYFDDILIYSKNWDEHWIHVEKVLSILRDHKLFVKKEKCQFGQECIYYLGHVISREGVAVDPEKVQAMLKWPKPKTLKAFRGFLGLTGYYRKFIQGYGKIAGPLTSSKKKRFIRLESGGREGFRTPQTCYDSSTSASSDTKLIRPPPRPHVEPLFLRGAMVRSRKFWNLTEKKKYKFLVMLRGITGTSLTSKSLMVLLEYSDDLFINKRRL